MSSSSNNNLFQTFWIPAFRSITENNINKFIRLTKKDNYEHVNMQRNDGSTLLHIACNSAKDEFILHLLRNGAKANILNFKGESPMYHLIDTFIKSHPRGLIAKSNFLEIMPKEFEKVLITLYCTQPRRLT